MSPSKTRWLSTVALLVSAVWVGGCVGDLAGTEVGEDATGSQTLPGGSDGGLAGADLSQPDPISPDYQLAEGAESFSIWKTVPSATEIKTVDTVSFTVTARNMGQTTLANGQLWVEGVLPKKNKTLVSKAIEVHLEMGTETQLARVFGPFEKDDDGDWYFTATLRNQDGGVLAVGQRVKVHIKPPHTNPLTGIVGYSQFNLSSTSGSCGSHSGAVALAYLKGLRDDPGTALSYEHQIYNKVPIAPGEGSLKPAYTSVASANKIPFHAISIGSGSVLGSIEAGIPVVAHVHNHYVCIYGLVDEGGTQTVYFSDGATGYGTSGSVSAGAGGHLRKMAWSAFLGKMAGGFIGFAQ